MNEAQIIARQISLERRHFSAVELACRAAIENGTFESDPAFRSACADYLRFAAERVACDSGKSPAPGVAAINGRGKQEWLEFLTAFAASATQHFASLEARLAATASIAERRRLSRIDADSIVSERTLFDKVTATLPSGVLLTDAPAR